MTFPTSNFFLTVLSLSNLSNLKIQKKKQLLGIAALRAAMADKAAATRAAAARKAGTKEVVAAEKCGEGEKEAEEPASKKQRRSASEQEAEREESPEVIVRAASVDAEAASRESSPEAPVTPEASGMEEEEDDAEASTAETTTEAAAAAAPTTSLTDAEDKDLDPSRFSHISDAAYSPQDVVDSTAALVAVLPARLRNGAPNAKMFLRSFWYRAVAGGALSESPSSEPVSTSSDGGDRMHVYTLASFFLQLSLLDLGSSEVAPSAAAAGALSLALEMYRSKASETSSCWPACLQRYSGIDARAVELQRERLRRVQSESAAPHLRAVWASRHELHGYPEFSSEWELALRTMREAGKV